MEYLDKLAYGLALGAFGVVVFEMIKVPSMIKAKPRPATQNPETKTRTVQPAEEKTRQIVADFQCKFCHDLIEKSIPEEKGCKKFEYAFSQKICDQCVVNYLERPRGLSTCRTCFQSFFTRTQLHVHLRAENHERGCIVPECTEDCLDVTRF